MASILLALLLSGCAPQDADVTGTWHVWLAANNSATVDEGKLDLAERATRIYECKRGWDEDRGDFELGYIGPRQGDTIGEGSRFFGGACDPADSACDQDLLDAQCAKLDDLEFYTFLKDDGYYYQTEPLDVWRSEAVMNGEGDFQLTLHNKLGNGQDMRFMFSIKPEFAPLECVDADGDGNAAVEYVDGRSWSEAWSEDEDGYTIYYLNAGSFQVDPSSASGSDATFWYFNSDWSAGFAYGKFAAEEFSVHATDYGLYDDAGDGPNFDLIEEYRNQCGTDRADTPPLPMIVGGDQNVALGDTVNLDGTGSSDPDGDELSYFWSVTAPSGSDASLLVDTPTASFVADVPGTYTVTLTVNDGAWAMSTTSTVTVEDPNHPPSCYALPGDTVAIGSTAILDASPTSDPDGDDITYNWRVQGQRMETDDDGNLVEVAVDDSFDDAGPSLPYTFDGAGDWTITMEAVDPDGASCASQTIYQVYDPGDGGVPSSFAPNCSAGVDLQGRYGDTFNLLGGVAVDPDGTAITYAWNIDSAPSGSTAVITMDDPSGASSAASFTADRSGTWRLSMTGTDEQGEACISQIVVDVRNNPPLCDAASAAWAASGEPVNLAASAADPDGDTVTGSWDLSYQPWCSDPDADLLTDAGDGTASLIRDVDGFYEATWLATDGDLYCYREVTVVASCDDHYLGGYACHQDDADAWAREISHVAMAGKGVDEALDGDPGFTHKTESNFWRPIDDRDAGLDGWAEVSSSWIRVKDGSALEVGGSAEGDFQILLEGFESSSVMVVEGSFKIDKIRKDAWAYPDLEEDKRDENGTPYCDGDTVVE